MFKDVYPWCFKHVGEDVWQELIGSYKKDADPVDFPDRLAQVAQHVNLPAYLSDLVCLEKALWKVNSQGPSIPESVSQLSVNPSLQVLRLSWKLLSALEQGQDLPPVKPQPGEEWVLIWRNQKQGKIHIQEATREDLLALKLVAEDIDFWKAARENEVPIGVIDRVIYQAARKGILLSPPSRIRRNTDPFSQENPVPEEFLSASTFSLQWHITNACDLKCKHCYDRTQRSPLTFDDAVAVLDNLYDFCKEHFVSGHVSFTGGNPFLYPRFTDLYRAASERGFALSILGNPTTRKLVKRILAIQPPRYFQVSLEGLKKHNDEIRGPGNYERVMKFLGTLKGLGVSSSVMLTLTRDNLNQILPLADRLRGLTGSFTFNRLSRVGEGAKLELPDKESYIEFLEAYAEATEQNPILDYKDNLFSILRCDRGERLLDGCTGYGCGAAFNFIAVLPDGEAHACRKFPSPIGNVQQQRIADIYDSQAAQKYRAGCRACDGCAIRHACGGCLAISYGFEQDIYSEKDPHCFMAYNKLS